VVDAFVVVLFRAVKFCSVDEPVVSRFEKEPIPEDKTPPVLLTENKEEPLEFLMSKRLALCPGAPMITSGEDAVVVDTTVSTAPEDGVVVPIDDCPVPLTEPDFCENTEDEIDCLGDKVSKDTPFEETSI